jgi:hypothetical protein
MVTRREFDFGPGTVRVGADGAVVAATHPRRRGSYLLSEDPAAPEAAFHEPAFRWGKGFVITDRGSHRFDAPTWLSWESDGARLAHQRPGLQIEIDRRIGASWTESYRVVNTGRTAVSIGSLAVSTPWRDSYFSAADSLCAAVHAHVWTGGRDSWSWAVPMDGSGPGLGLVLTEGTLEAYSVESRNVVTSSNIRGHLYLHVTDHARNPDAMGGQRPVDLAPGESYRWSWRIDWYDDLASFARSRRELQPSLISADRLHAEHGETIALTLADGATTRVDADFTAAHDQVVNIWAERAGERSRICVYAHPPLRDLVEARVRFVLERQRAVERADVRREAFLPYDNRTGLTVLHGGWADWNDGRERIGTAQLLQQALRLGWGDRVQIDEALAGYHRFVVETLVDADGTVHDDSRRRGRARLYNAPWVARFLLDQGDLDATVRILDRYYGSGGEHFLAFDLGPLLRTAIVRLRAIGRTTDADRLRSHLLGHAAAFLAYGNDLPAHEVNYEQSMVAPLVELLLAAHLEDPTSVAGPELARRLRWLTAFSADQPDVRLCHVPIRHWDGFWFGALQLWGDVFPHYWAVLSAAVFLSWPETLSEPDELARLRAMGEQALAATLTNFSADGSASCAFVYPSCVDARPAHVTDPLANDQDWALVYALRRLG